MKNGKNNTSNPIEEFGNAIMYFTAPIVLKLLDIITTAKFLQLGIKEGNPFIAWLMSIDLNLAYAVSFFSRISVFVSMYLIERHVVNKNELGVSTRYFKKVFKMTYFLLIGIFLYVVIHNLIAISYGDVRILV